MSSATDVYGHGTGGAAEEEDDDDFNVVLEDPVPVLGASPFGATAQRGTPQSTARTWTRAGGCIEKHPFSNPC
jgi:hypothetical protein